MSQATVKEVDTGYVPRKWQARAHHLLKRHNVLVFHRRGGKSVFSVNVIKDKIIKFDKMCPTTGRPLKDPQFAFVATTRQQVEQIAWKYFKEYFKNFPGVKFNESKLRCTFPHPRGLCTIYLFGAENFDAMRGIYLDGYVLDEYADMHPDVRDKVLLPTLSDRLGWEIIIGTPKGENAFKRIYDFALDAQYTEDKDDWYTCLYRASETGILPPTELRMLKRTMSEEAYAQEYECDFNAAPSGKYYQKYIDDARREGRITSVPYDRSVPVSTFWDLGYNDSTALWFVQEVGREIRVLEYLEEHGKGLEWYVNQIDARPYMYNTHYLPHDANHHELSTGRTRVEFLEDHGLENIEVVPKTNNVAEDIHAVRQILPQCWFDSNLTAKGINCLTNYERKWDARLQIYSDKPLHNWASHGSDAFRTFAMAYQPGFSRSSMRRDLPKQGVSDYDILTDF